MWALIRGTGRAWGVASSPLTDGTPSADPASIGRLRRTVRWIVRWIARALLVLLVVTVLAYAFRVPLFGGWIRGRVAEGLTEALGTPCEVGGIGGSWWSDLELHDVRTLAPGSGALREVSIEHLHARFDLLELLDDPAAAIEAVTVTRARVVLQEATSEGPTTPPGDVLAQVPDPLPEIDVDVELNWFDGAAEARLGTVRLRGGGASLDVTATDLPPVERIGLPPTEQLEVTIARTGVGELTVEVSAVHGLDGVSATFEALADAPWSARATVRALGGSVIADVHEGGVAGELVGLQLAALPKWLRAKLLPGEDELAALVVGTFAVDERGAPSVDLYAADIRLGAWDAEVLQLKAALRDGVVEVTSADVTGRLGSLALTNALIDPASPWVLTAAETLRGEIGDVAAVLAQFEVAGTDRERLRGVRLSLGASVAGNGVTVTHALAVRGNSSLDLSGTVSLPSDPVGWRVAVPELELTGSIALAEAAGDLGVAGEAAGDVVVVARVAGSAGAPSVAGEAGGIDLVWNGQDISVVTIQGSGDAEHVEVERVSLSGSLGLVAAAGSLAWGERTFDLRTLSADVRDAARLAALAGLPEGWRGTLGAEGALSGRLDADGNPVDLVGRLELRGADLEAPGLALGRLDGTAEIAWPRVDLLVDSLAGPLGTAAGRVVLDVDAATLDATDVSVDVPDLAALDAALGLELGAAGQVVVSGNARLAMEGDLGGRLLDARVGGALVATGLRIGVLEIGNAEARLTATTDGAVLETVRVDGPLARLTTRGEATLRDGELDVRLDLLDGVVHALEREVTIALRTPARLSVSADSATISELDADIAGAHLTGRVTRGAELDADLSLTGFELARLVDDVTGTVTANLRASGPVSAPLGELSIRSSDVSAAGESGAVDVLVAQDADGLLVRRLVVRLGDLLIGEAEGRLPFRIDARGALAETGSTGSYRVAVRAARPDALLARLGASGVAATELSLEAEGDATSLRAAVVARDLRLRGGDGAQQLATGVTALEVRGNLDGVTMRLRVPDGAALHATGDVTVAAPFDLRDPQALRERFAAAPLRGRVTTTIDELSGLATLIPEVQFLRGALQADVMLAGTVTDPRWSGQVSGTRVSLRLDGDVPTLSDGVLAARIDADAITIERFEGLLGYAPISASGTIALVDGAAHAIDLRIQGENALLVRSPHLRLRADLDLALTGTAEAPTVAGTVRITDALYSRPMNLLGRSAPAVDDRLQLFSFRHPRLAAARLDIRVVADETLRIENNVLFGTLSADLRVRGTGEVPEPEGRITVRDTIVTLPLSRLHVDRGEVTFPPAAAFDPTVTAAASSRMRGYDLTVHVSGPLANARVNVTSSPPLSNEAARLLLATGSTPEELERDGIASTALSKAGTLLGDALLTWVSGPRDPDSSSMTDRLTVEFGRDRSRSGASTIDAELRLAERWYLRGQRDRFDDLNLGLVWRVRFR